MTERSASPELITVDDDDGMGAVIGQDDGGGASLNQSAGDFVEPAGGDIQQASNAIESSCPPAAPVVEESVPATRVDQDTSDDGACCTICFESWSNSGPHRIASLRCGHLFGQSCIERWLRGREQRCPHCNEKASVRDIRAVFAKSVRVLDTSERDRALQDLSDEKERRRKLELDYSIMKMKCSMQEKEIARLQRELLAQQGLNSSVSDSSTSRHPSSVPPPTSASGSRGWSLALDASVNVSRGGGCRVMRHSRWLGLLAVSQPSQHALFPGHGVRCVNTLDMRAAHYSTLHTKQIRDLAFHPSQHQLLLSVALDGRAVLTNMQAGARVQHWATAGACWSCAWDQRRPHCCYVGLSSGAVLAVDWRHPDQPLCRLECMGSGSAGSAGPVVGLCHVAHSESVDTLVVCRLSTCSLVNAACVDSPPPPSSSPTIDVSQSTLPLAGPFTSLAHLADTGHVLISARPSARAPHAIHAVCQLSAGSVDSGVDGVEANVVRLLHGDTSQRLMSRSSLLPVPLEDKLMVAAGLESSSAVQLWSVDSGASVQRLAASSPVLDVCSVEGGSNPLVTMLNENQLKVYSWHERK